MDASSIILDGASASNTNDGTLYATVTKAAGTTSGTSKYTIDLYSDSARTTKVATGEVDDVADGGLPEEIELAESGGSGLQGSMTLDAYYSTKDSDSDSTILIQVPRYFVRLYKSSYRSSTDLVAEGVSYQAQQSSLSIDPVSSGGTAGAVDLDYVQDNQSIELTVDFRTIDMFRADPGDLETTDDDIVARAGSRDEWHAYGAGTDDVPFFAVNGSGIVSASVDAAGHASTGTVGYVASAQFGYAVGDRFSFEMTTDDNGRFQTFLRENYDKVFPADAFPTVPDSLSEG